MDWQAIGIGFVVFTFGMFMKVALADNAAPYVDSAFDPGIRLTFGEAWVATLGYSLQLFFDFAGYSAMALGLAKLFGLSLPLNFNDPLRAASLVDCWARWHITMTRFLMKYIYTPLWFRRRVGLLTVGLVRRRSSSSLAVSLDLSHIPRIWIVARRWMDIRGIGAVHGCSLIVNQIWRQWKLPKPPKAIGWLLMLAVFCLAVSFFRAENWDQGAQVFTTMLQPWHLSVPPVLASLAQLLHLPIDRSIFC